MYSVFLRIPTGHCVCDKETDVMCSLVHCAESLYSLVQRGSKRTSHSHANRPVSSFSLYLLLFYWTCTVMGLALTGRTTLAIKESCFQLRLGAEVNFFRDAEHPNNSEYTGETKSWSETLQALTLRWLWLQWSQSSNNKTKVNLWQSDLRKENIHVKELLFVSDAVMRLTARQNDWQVHSCKASHNEDSALLTPGKSCVLYF